MNKARRQGLKLVLSKIEELSTTLEEVKECLQLIIDDEQEAFDNLPDSIQCSERGQQMEECIDTMQEVLDSLDEVDAEDMYQSLEVIAEG